MTEEERLGAELGALADQLLKLPGRRLVEAGSALRVLPSSHFGAT